MSTERVNVVFGADTGPLRSGVNQAKQALGGLKSSVGQIGSSLAALFSVGMVRQFVGEIARIQDLADRFGIGAEQMQRLGFVASQNGADIETMATALQRATVAAEAAMSGNKKAADAFADLNINVRDFAKASPEEKLAMLADGFNGAASEGQAMAAVLAIAGKSAGELIPALRQGGDAIRETANSIQVASAETVAALAEMDDAIDRFSASSKAPFAEFLAVLVKVSATVLEVAKVSGNAFGSMVGVIKESLRALVTGNDEAFNIARETFLGQMEAQEGALGKAIDEIWNPVAKPPRAGRSGRTIEDGFVNPEIGDEEYGPGGDAAIEEKQRKFQEERDKRLEDARRYYAFLESKRAVEAGLTQAEKDRAGLGFGVQIADSLAAIGGGGGVYGAENPQIQRMDQQIEFLKTQLQRLTEIEKNTGKGKAMRQ